MPEFASDIWIVFCLNVPTHEKIDTRAMKTIEKCDLTFKIQNATVERSDIVYKYGHDGTLSNCLGELGKMVDYYSVFRPSTALWRWKGKTTSAKQSEIL